MGSFCGSGTQKTTTNNTSSSSTTPRGQAELFSIFNRIQGASETPFTPYGGQMTAGLSPTQQAGINNISAVAGPDSPFINQAAGYANTGASEIDPANIQRYINPYVNNVVDATQANFNQSNKQQYNDIAGNAAAAGALGGDRLAVAKAETARQQNLAQNPVIAGLHADAYKQALAAAQGDRSASQWGAGAFTGINDAALRGGQAQLAAGNVEQGTNQAALEAQYKEFMRQQQAPYMNAAFLSQYGLPTATAFGSNSSGTGQQVQEVPGPDKTAQMVGLGLSAASLLSDERAKEDVEPIGKTFDGQPIYKFRYKNNPAMHIGLLAQDVERKHPHAVGEAQGLKTVNYDMATSDAAERGHFASGGAAISRYFVPDAMSDYISGGGPMASPLMAAPMLSMQSPMANPANNGGGGNGNDQIMKGLRDVKGAFGGMGGGFGGGSSGGAAPSVSMGDAMGIGGLYSHGGGVGDFMSTVHSIRDGLRRANGGRVRGFADGGWAMDDRFNAAFPMAATDIIEDPGLQRVSSEAMQAWRNGVDQPNPAVMADVGASAMTNRAPTVQLPPQITGPAPQAEPGQAMAFDATNPMQIAPPPGGPAASPMASPANTMGGFNPFNFSDKTRQSIMAAGLGMAGSRSPNGLTALADGARIGLGTYAQMGQAEREEAAAKETKAQQQQRIDMEAKRLQQSAEQFSKTHGLNVRTQDQREKDSKDSKERGKWSYLGPSEDGKSSVFMNGVTGETEERAIKVAPKIAPNKPMDEETAEFLAERVRAGDTKALIGLGRGAQGAENLAKIQGFVARKSANGEPISDAARSILANAANQEGFKAAERRQATIMANLSVYGRTAFRATDLAEKASDAVPRTEWMPVNKVMNAWKTNTGDTKIVALGAAINSLVNEYARAISGGQPRVADKEHAMEMLNAAQSPEQFRAVIGMMRQELVSEEKAMPEARSHMKGMYNPTSKDADHSIADRPGAHKEPAAAPAAAPSRPSAIPAGAAYSPSRKQWKAPDGTLYDESGKKVSG